MNGIGRNLRPGRALPLLGIVLWISSSFTACGGSGSVSSEDGTIVSASFFGGNPAAIAERFGSGAWSPVSVPSDGQLTVVVPDGTTSYEIAYLCDETISRYRYLVEVVYEATTQDPTTFKLPCYTNTTPVLDTINGSVDASAIPSTTE